MRTCLIIFISIVFAALANPFNCQKRQEYSQPGWKVGKNVNMRDMYEHNLTAYKILSYLNIKKRDIFDQIVVGDKLIKNILIIFTYNFHNTPI
ncbi:hypothetical protein BpHYR1_023729 [Brachionus plicatilis]|uniref:Uncharacterized protein n=1 Tax=Brachionus plicatilis TaxID=10195 RepID=A0A3M7RTD3_BRAPC|nr:hypothetical protein BpHYR1_023729 [Brachionus plicatilis]